MWLITYIYDWKALNRICIDKSVSEENNMGIHVIFLMTECSRKLINGEDKFIMEAQDGRLGRMTHTGLLPMFRPFGRGHVIVIK